MTDARQPQATDIFGARWFDRNLANWHPAAKGKSYTTAAEAVEDQHVGEMFLARVEAHVGDKTLRLGSQAIIRSNGTTESLGIVSADYELITPQQTAQAWDQVVARPIQSAAFRGDRLIFTTPLPSFDVLGDEVEMYLWAVNQFDGKHAASVWLSPFRVWCLNQVTIAEAEASWLMRIVHTAGAFERFTGWLNHAVTEAESSRELVAENCRLLARTPIRASEVEPLLQQVYPFPRKPRRTAPSPVMAKRWQRWEYLTQRVEAYREAAAALFAGAGTGMEHPAMRNSCWGLLNAVVECEDWRQTRNESDLDTALELIVFGERSDTKRRAYEVVMDLARAA